MRIALTCWFSITVLAGCSIPQASTTPTSAFSELKAATMSRDRKSENPTVKSANLVYLSYGRCGWSSCVAQVAIYTFPGGQPIGTWNASGYAGGGCADKAGNVFITYVLGSIGEILEFSHGVTNPAATLSDPLGSPAACSVDPVSGDLAVADGLGALLIYHSGSGDPTIYNYPGVYFYGVTYGSKGNVFIDGVTGGQSPQFVLAKLPKDGGPFENITLNEQVGGVGELGWDGQYLTIENTSYKIEKDLIDRFDIRGTSGRFEGATQPNGLLGAIDQYSIVGKQIVIAYSWKPCHAICTDEGTVGIWKYPSGRNITESFTPDGSPSTGMALGLK